MAIGTAAAIGLGVAGIGSALGARSQSKAAGKAADTSAQVARENNALAREIYGKNEGYLNPYVQRGNKAGDAINAMLGLGGGPEPMQIPANNGNAFNPMGGGTQSGNPYGAGGWDWREPRTDNGGYSGNPFAGFGGMGVSNQPLGSIGGNPIFAQNQPQAGQPAQTAQQAQENAFGTFRNSTGYQFRLNEGQDALNSGYAGRGVLRSGAAAKGFADYNQNVASNEFGNYMGYLSNQQGVGLGGASALAGVGQNYVNNVSANNNSAGSAAANAALVKGQNNPFASIFGTVGGGLLGSSFG